MIFASIYVYSLTDLFWMSAIIGTTLFVLRMAVMLLGGLVDFHHDDGHHYDSHSHDHSPSIKLITFHSLAGFCMMFGWTGLAAFEQFGLSALQSVILASIAGLLLMISVAFLFKAAKKLEASGAVFNTHQTIGLVGTVYQFIPAQGIGKIQVQVHGMTRELLAQSYSAEPIESFEAIKIINIIDQETVQVVSLRRSSHD